MEKEDKIIPSHSLSDSDKSTLSESENINDDNENLFPEDNEAALITPDEAAFNKKINRYVTYLIRDENKRILCIDSTQRVGDSHAYFGQEETNYHDFIMIIHWNTPAPTVPKRLVGKYYDHKFFLYSNDMTNELNWAIWDTPNSQPEEFLILIRAEYVKTEDGVNKYKYIWNYKGKDIYLCSDLVENEREWSWLYLSDKKYSLFSQHIHYIQSELIKMLCQKTWPNITFKYHKLRIMDRKYCVISDRTAQYIYKQSELKNFKYRQESFDCDDFCYIYKAQASKEAYISNERFGYALGIIVGTNKEDQGHSVNIYINDELKVKLIEPQTGKIINGEDWDHRPTFILI
ncbi:hypothetical protein Xbed_01590 [Xenorhabdus beddingii]|uniref:Agglutinin C-terminal domain-containing protein n=1 Tax=Xenorhabdus beddingii TaxID=40578 RepID=A0A1Y2SQ63_9GAMM|nr:lectin MOA-related protein [Xenorhabdus beddingii]OTA20364.1 hypothetical protein Xbed_01590 [Xenorhabdus beddingii]